MREATPGNKPWKNEKQRDFVLTQYIMERLQELSNTLLRSLTEKQMSELDPHSSRECMEAALSYKGVEYITRWVERNKVPIDIEKLVKEGESNFRTLLGAYQTEYPIHPEGND